MSNVLIKERLYDGVLIKTTEIISKTEAENRITLSCGASLVAELRPMASRGLGGLEGLWGIPGTVGGMVKQNAGAYGYETADRLIGATCYVRSAHTVTRYTKEELNFAYRDSLLSDKNFVLLNATFELVPKLREDVLSEVKDYALKRRASQPIEYPSLGSVFKRYNGVSAAYYIDGAGLKGYAVGGARVSEKHAGFIVNSADATADDYLRLIDYVKERVMTVFGIELKEEIEII